MDNLPILTIRQPWAWAIMHAGKDIENRDRRSHYRGRFWVHAGKIDSHDEFEQCKGVMREINPNAITPLSGAVNFGGIIGSVELVDCVIDSESPWFFGTYGYVLQNPKTCKFVPMKGQQGFFKRLEMDGVKP